MFGTVSGVLQTRKTTKIHVEFLPIRYNRDSNANDHPVAFIIATSLSASWSHCTQIDLQPKVLRVVQHPWNPVMSSSASRLRYEIVRGNAIQTSLIARPRDRNICTKWNGSEWSMSCLPERDHMYRHELRGFVIVHVINIKDAPHFQTMKLKMLSCELVHAITS